MNRRKLIVGAVALTASAALPAPAEAETELALRVITKRIDANWGGEPVYAQWHEWIVVRKFAQ